MTPRSGNFNMVMACLLTINLLYLIDYAITVYLVIVITYIHSTVIESMARHHTKCNA